MEPLYRYHGALCIKCEKCGKIHTFSTKKEFTHALCECGHKTFFTEPLRPLWINCECGGRRRYLTNLTESLADVECFRCGAPVTVSWNRSRHCYQTVKG